GPGGPFEKANVYHQPERVNEVTGEVVRGDGPPVESIELTPTQPTAARAFDAVAAFRPAERLAWGGKRTPRCPDHPSAPVKAALVCAVCRRALRPPETQLASVKNTGGASPDMQVEPQAAAPGGNGHD